MRPTSHLRMARAGHSGPSVVWSQSVRDGGPTTWHLNKGIQPGPLPIAPAGHGRFRKGLVDWSPVGLRNCAVPNNMESEVSFGGVVMATHDEDGPPVTSAGFDIMAPRRRILSLAGMGAVGALLAACGSAAATSRPTASSPAGASARTPASASALASKDATARTWLYLAILTGKMDGKKGWPQFLPANFRVAANSTVQAEIRCFDDGVASIPSGYEKVRGTVGGSMTILSAVNGDVSTAKSQTVQAVDPKNVAHTLTFADTGMNIPIPPLSTVRFTFKAGPAGTHGWQCMSACGSGGGWGGPMSAAGWMKGTMTVV